MKLPANSSVNVSVAFVNANGNPAQVDGEVTWESSDPAIATVAMTTDSAHARITAGPTAGQATIFATADSDLGEGVVEVNAELEVVVIARGVAIGGEIVPDMVNNGVPGVPGAGIDNSLPGVPVTPDNTLPTQPPRPDVGVDNELPSGPGRPDNTLPPGAKPK
jgi:hypothetical protein